MHHAWDFHRELAVLVRDPGTTLQTLNRHMLKVDDPESVMTEALQADIERLATTWTQNPSFVSIRLAELFHGAGLIHNDDYVLAAIGHLGGRHDGTGIRRFMLTHDRELRESVFWRFFEVEGGGEISLSNVDKFSDADCSWKDTVLDLVRDGVLDRARVLASCLDALNRDFSSYRAGWFSRLYDALEPQTGETRQHHEALLVLLASSHTATLSLAVRRLAVLQRDGSLDSARFIAGCVPALSGSKAAALKVLAILGDIAAAADSADATNRGDPAGSTFAAVSRGLSHPHPDVQRAAAALLVKHHREGLLLERAGSLDSAVAAEFRLATSGTAAAGSPLTTAPTASTARAAAAALPAPPVIAWQTPEAPERLAALVESDADGIEVELALAWLAANEATEVLAPLARRAARLRDNPDRVETLALDLVLSGTEPCRALRPGRHGTHVQARTKGLDHHAGSGRQAESSIPLFRQRVREVIDIMHGHAGRRILLATPTDRGGWIDPDALVNRFVATDSGNLTTLHFDTVGALLRLGTDGRAEALEKLCAAHVSPANQEACNALAYALGGPCAPVVNAAWWVAAGRARAPHSADVHLHAAGLVLPGQATPATLALRWSSNRTSYEHRGERHSTAWWNAVAAAGPESGAVADFPTMIPSRVGLGNGSPPNDTPLDIHQTALSVPADTRPFVSAAIHVLVDTLDSGARSGQEHVLRALERHPGSWHEETATLLGLALSAQRADLRIAAAELLVLAVPHRISAERCAAGMATVAGVSTYSRWATSFADAANISGQAAAVVTDVLCNLLPMLERTDHGIGALLAVLLEECARTGDMVRAPALRDWLASFSGSSSAARSARALLAMQLGA